MSPLSSNPVMELDKRDSRGSRESWESEMSVDSLTSINSILSEEGSLTSTGRVAYPTCDLLDPIKPDLD